MDTTEKIVSICILLFLCLHTNVHKSGWGFYSKTLHKAPPSPASWHASWHHHLYWHTPLPVLYSYLTIHNWTCQIFLSLLLHQHLIHFHQLCYARRFAVKPAPQSHTLPWQLCTSLCLVHLCITHWIFSLLYLNPHDRSPISQSSFRRWTFNIYM